MELSTWETSVVGTCTRSTPRRYVAATNPTTSPMTPPPTATIRDFLSAPARTSSREIDSTVRRFLRVSASFTRCTLPEFRTPKSLWILLPTAPQTLGEVTKWTLENLPRRGSSLLTCRSMPVPHRMVYLPADEFTE